MSDLKTISIDPITKRASFVLESKTVTGIDKLIQIVITTLLTGTGSDLLEEDGGGGLEDLIGYNLGEDDLSEVQSEITRRVTRTQTQIIRNQIGLDVSAEEKLRSIDIKYIRQGEELGSVDVRLKIENELGRTRDVVI